MDFKRRCLSATGETCSRPKAAMLTGQAQAGQCLQLKSRFFCPGEIGTAGAASSSPPLLTAICNDVSVAPRSTLLRARAAAYSNAISYPILYPIRERKRQGG